MKIVSYMDENIKNILVLDDNNSLCKEDFLSELKGFYDKLNITIIEITVIPLFMIEVLNVLIKKYGDYVSLGITSRYLSNYLVELNINHKYYKVNDDEYMNVVNNNYTLDDIENNKIEKFLERIFTEFGNDFREYNTSSIKKTILKIMKKNRMDNFEIFERLVFEDFNHYKLFIDNMSISVSDFFRDKDFFKMLREDILKNLASHHHFKIWSAGCANGMEPYSIAILLKEYGLLDRCVIYATDFNEDILNIARNGIFSRNVLEKASENYLESGGVKNIRDYFINNQEYFEIDTYIKEKVNFFNHDLTNDATFNEFDLILCRNVLIYFDDPLKKRVLQLFYDSLSNDGYLGLGKSESIHYYRTDKFIQYKKGHNIYRKNLKGLVRVK